ncbi:cell wall-binding repeat-containing protein, partial [Desulfosporosinus sp. PR]|uniref:cell wall-binding repeat-containing protein n=1 Tax=Candidatus Desulfosporosinus nitrosoreducens TaxID=3401928 RepID=UPI0027E8797F
MSLRKKNSKLCLILIVITLISLAIPTVTLADSSPTITRLAGIDRYETASQIARSGWSQSDYAILAFGGDYPDALSAAPLAKKFNAPILLTDTGSLPSTTKQALLDLQVKKVVIIGGTAVISQAVQSELQTMGLGTTRIYGNDRYATAVQVAQQVNSKPATLFVVTGEDYPDALSVASIASMKQIPIILVPYDVMPDTVKSYLSTLNVSKTYVVGDSD